MLLTLCTAGIPDLTDPLCVCVRECEVCNYVRRLGIGTFSYILYYRYIRRELALIFAIVQPQQKGDVVW